MEKQRAGTNPGDGPASTAAFQGEVLTVAVGSSNPSKVKAVEDAFKSVFPESGIRAIPFAVESGVADQPMTDAETRRGAVNRAKGALEAYKAANGGVSPDYAVGLEGGLTVEHFEDEEGRSGTDGVLLCFAWMVVIGTTASDGGKAVVKIGSAKTGTFCVPEPVAALVRQGVELGVADDAVFARRDSKKGDGLVGILSGGLIDRSHYYRHALVLACLPFMPRNAQVYE